MFQTSGGACPKLAPLHSQRMSQARQQQDEGQTANAALEGVCSSTLPGPCPAAAGAAQSWRPATDAASAGRGGSSCSMQALPGGSRHEGSPAHAASPGYEIEAADLQPRLARTPADAGCLLPDAWLTKGIMRRQVRSPADRDEVPVGAAHTPSFDAIIRGAEQRGDVGMDAGSESEGCSSTAASRPVMQSTNCPAASGGSSTASTPGEASGTAPAEHEEAAPHLAACSSSDALLAAEGAGASSTEGASLIPAASCGQQRTGRRLSPRPLLAQLAQALHARPQRAAAPAGDSKSRRRKQPAAEDVRPRALVAPAVQAAAVRRGRLAAGRSVDENSPV